MRSIKIFTKFILLIFCYGIIASSNGTFLYRQVDLLGKISSGQVTKAADGINIYSFKFDSLYGLKQSIHVAEIDLTNPKIKLKMVHDSKNMRKRVSAFAAENPGTVVAANLGFFVMKDPSEFVGTFKDPELTVNPEAGSGSPGYLYFADDTVFISSKLDINLGKYIRGGFPILIENGKINENMPQSAMIKDNHPRTAYGITAEKKFIIVVVDGRAPADAQGITCRNLADFMKKIGCVSAVNMDGGGSAVLWSKTRGIVSYPCDNKKYDHLGERWVLDAVIVQYMELVAN